MERAIGSKDDAAGPVDRGPPSFRRGRVQDKVFESLRHGLMVGAFVPGQILSLRKLAAHLGTSAMPVRDALAQLIAANALEALPNRSVRVPRLSQSRLAELAEVRIAIEGMAARKACLKAGRELVNRLQSVNHDLLRAIGKRDIVGCLALNQSFHFDLYRAAESEVLMPLIESLWVQYGPTMYFSLLAPDMPWDASAHMEILEALRIQDAVMAQRAVGRDIRTTTKHLLKGNNFNRFDGPLAAPDGYITFADSVS